MEKASEEQQESKLNRRAKLWSQELSPVRLMRVVRDKYVKGCVTFGKNSRVARASAFQVVGDDNSFTVSHSWDVHDIAALQEILDQSQGWVRGAPGKGPPHHGLTMADLRGHSGPLRKAGASGLTMADLQGYSGPLRTRPTSFAVVPESEQYIDSHVSQIALDALDSLHSSSLRAPRARSRFPSASVSPITPSTKPQESHRHNSFTARASSRSRRTSADQIPRPPKKNSTRPNPYREYDTRAPSATPTA